MRAWDFFWVTRHLASVVFKSENGKVDWRVIINDTLLCYVCCARTWLRSRSHLTVRLLWCAPVARWTDFSDFQWVRFVFYKGKRQTVVNYKQKLHVLNAQQLLIRQFRQIPHCFFSGALFSYWSWTLGAHQQMLNNLITHAFQKMIFLPFTFHHWRFLIHVTLLEFLVRKEFHLMDTCGRLLESYFKHYSMRISTQRARCVVFSLISEGIYIHNSFVSCHLFY